MTQAVTIPVSAQGLASLADLARRNGTQNAFIDMAVQWALQAAQEIDRLRAEVEALRAALEPFAAGVTYAANGTYTITVYGRELLAARAALAAKSLMQEQPK